MPIEIISDPVEQQKILRRIFKQGSRTNKYNAKKVIIGDMVFDSQQEYERWKVLVILERTGHISQLRRQVPYPFFKNEIKICTYYADFVYNRDGDTVVEDAKGCLTKEYRMKRKMMMAHYGIKILETGIKKRRGKRCR